MRRLIDTTQPEFEPDALYEKLEFPPASDNRPYLFINMVSSIDGKTLLGERGGTAAGLGSPTDQMLMGRIRRNADWVIIGSSTLRAEGNISYPSVVGRSVVTQSGDLPLDSPFFTSSRGKAVVFAPKSMPPEKVAAIRDIADLHQLGEQTLDASQMVEVLRKEYGVERLLGEGGAAFNATLFEAQVVDELFLTFAPKIRGGEHLPTVVDGSGLPPDKIAQLEIVSLYEHENECYFRYRVVSASESSPIT